VPRAAQFDHDDLLNAALRVIATRGPAAVSIEAIAAEMGGNVGSIYHRFASKDHLLAQLWLRCSERGQTGMVAALTGDDLDHALTVAVLHYPRWARTNLSEAQVLAAYGREHLLPSWPAELASELETANKGLLDALATFAARWYGDDHREHGQAVTFAVLDIPVAAIRRYLLNGRRPPRRLDAHIVAAARAALCRG